MSACIPVHGLFPLRRPRCWGSFNFLAFWSGPWCVTDGDNGHFLSSWEISPGWLCAVLLGGE